MTHKLPHTDARAPTQLGTAAAGRSHPRGDRERGGGRKGRYDEAERNANETCDNDLELGAKTLNDKFLDIYKNI